MSICVVVVSCALPTQKPLSYSSIRSIYTYEERIIQTRHTLASIAKNIPFAKVILVEGGMIDIKEFMPTNIEYYYIGSNPIVRWGVDSPFKGLGEAVMLLYAMMKCGFDKEVDLFFKLSARYVLTSSFCLDSWSTDKISFLFRNGSVSTRFYAVSKKCIRIFIFALLCSIPSLMLGESIENVLPRFVRKKHIASLEFLGINGYVGPDGNFINE